MNYLTASKLSLKSLVLLFFINISQSCKHEPPSISGLQTVCYDTQVLPIFAACSQCHSGNDRRGGFDPTSYSSVMRSVKPGDPWRSKLYTIVSSPNNPNMMPPKGHNPLSIAQRTTIEVWILQGAKETKCDTIH